MERTQVARTAMQIMTDASLIDRARQQHEDQPVDQTARYERISTLRRILNLEEGT